MRAVERRGHAIAYAKSKSTIRELLVHMGAHDAALSFEEAEVISATRDRANRNTNWDEANLGRMSEASRAQRHAIEQLDLDALDPRLQQVARLRLRHADLSLTELGKRARPPLSKSAVARRMRTLMSWRPIQAVVNGGAYLLPYNLLKNHSDGGRGRSVVAAH